MHAIGQTDKKDSELRPINRAEVRNRVIPAFLGALRRKRFSGGIGGGNAAMQSPAQNYHETIISLHATMIPDHSLSICIDPTE